MNYQNLKFRRQFLFTDQKIVPIEKWNYHELKWNDNDYFLQCHPDLECTHASSKLTIYLLGYIIDPLNPEFTNSDIIQSFSDEENYESVLERTDIYNGRYVMIIFDIEKIIALNDATASKQLYYTFNSHNCYVASSPNLISNYTELTVHGDDELHAFFNSDKFKNNNTAWFGNETPYENVYNLFPNNYLDVTLKTTTRFWPRGSLKSRSLMESIDYVSSILKGTIEGASKRYQLHSSLTGGWDSRMILSSEKQVKDVIKYYTIINDTIIRKNINDVIIPERLSKKHALTYDQIRLNGEEADDQFLEIFKNNSLFNRNVYSHIYYKYIQLGFEDYMNVTGTMGDQLLKVFYRFKGGITAQKFAKQFNVHKFPYTVKAIDKWLKEIVPIQKDYPIHTIDWFNWEFYSANWAGISATEHDIARDELRIFNCRELITTFMQIDEKFRYRDNPKMHKMVVKKLWEELLEFSVEPSNIQFRKVKKLLRLIGVEKLVDNQYQNIKYLIKK